LNVLVIDDSAVIRQAMIALLSRDSGLSVQTAADPILAMSKMRRQRPDVILLDLEMPRMHGLTFLRRLMAEDPIPVVVCSAATDVGTAAALRALEEGAVEAMAKPRLVGRDLIEGSGPKLIDIVRGAAASQPRRPRGRRRETVVPNHSTDAVVPVLAAPSSSVATDTIVVMGASTGGTEALRVVLETMPPDCPAIVVVQHLPELFTKAFADRLNQSCPIVVREAADGEPLARGQALVAPGGRHTLIMRSGGQYAVEVKHGPTVSRHRPSVDVLFRSAALAAGANTVAVIMTGMGGDGAAGMAELRQAGAVTIAQDEGSCVVFGMPKEAISRGGVDHVVPLTRIPSVILSNVRAGDR
jgi:two-component system chemotaxis response regulator CheB